MMQIEAVPMRLRRLRVIGICAALVVGAGCADDAEPPFSPPPDDENAELPAGLFVSESHPIAEAVARLGSGASTRVEEVAYVAAEPLTFPGGISATVRNVTADDPPLRPAPIIEGGFDPIAVPARTGDALELTIESGTGVEVLRLTVPPERPPVVVRTDPPKGRTDVALSIRIYVVFSEPIDPATLGPSSVRLLRGVEAVTASATLVPGKSFMLELTPDGALDPSTRYDVLVTGALRDLDGLALSADVGFDFTTTSSGGDASSDDWMSYGGFAVSNVGADGLAYVSLEPSIDGQSERASVLITNWANGDTASAPVQQDGFDPVPISARTGDRLQLRTSDADGRIIFYQGSQPVPTSRPPTLVRTVPSGGRDEVPLAVQPRVIFSEPVDPQSIDPSTLQLLNAGSPVAGSGRVAADAAYAIEFLPDGPLQPSTHYELVATGVRDLDGEVLYPPQGVRVGFTTTATEDGGYTTGADLTIANVTSGGAFDLDGYRFDITLPGAEPRSVDVDLNKVFRLEGLPPGSAVIDLADVAVNCSVAGGTSRSVELADGARARVDFDIQCTPPPELASVRLVFSRFDMLGGFGLWAINADGTGLRQLTPNVGAFDIGPKVSPVGSRVAFSRDWSGTGWGNFQIYLVNADGTDLLRLTETPLAIAWSWSPDGTRIASSPTSPGNIDLVEVDGSGRTRILGGFGGRTGFAPSWSPDGGTIAFYEGSLGSDCNVRIAAMDPDGGNVRVLRSLAGCTIGDLSWSSDGATIFFGDQDPDVYPALWRMDADGSNAQLVYPADDHVSGFGSLSADGRMMTVICRSDLCLLNLDEGTLVRVTADRKSWGGDFLP